MKKKLIWFKINGIKELENLKVNLLATDQKTEDEKYYSLLQAFPINERVYINKTNFIHGKNASGKTSLIKLIKSIESFSSPIRQPGVLNQNLLFSFFGETEKKIEVTAFYALSNYIFKHKITFSIFFNNQLQGPGNQTIYAAKIHKESFSHVAIRSTTTTNSIVKLFEDEERWKEYSIEGTNKLTDIFNVEFSDKYRPINSKMNQINYSYISDYMLNVIFASELKKQFGKNFDNVLKNIKHKPLTPEEQELIQKTLTISEEMIIPESNYITSNHLTNIQFFAYAIQNGFYENFIKTFDKNVEEIWISDNNIWNIKLKNEKRPRTVRKLEDVLSTGTIRGIEVFSLLIYTFATGGDIYIDEIEQNFNHKIVAFIMQLVNDKKINSSSRVFATTHYPATLDFTPRRDNITLTEIDKSILKLTKLNTLKDVKNISSKRIEYENSKLVSKIWSLDIEPAITELNKTKRMIKNAIGDLNE